MKRRKSTLLLTLALLLSVAANIYLFQKVSAEDDTGGVEPFVVEKPTAPTVNTPSAPNRNRPQAVVKTKGVAEQMLYRNAYTVSYNKDTRNPNYVAWVLTAAHADGDVKRPGNAWHEDEQVPAPRATNADYKGSIWSRGHMCPAGDNKWDRQAMYETFCFTNICPQDKGLNAGVWNDIEMTCRRWARNFGEVTIVCGPIYQDGKSPATIGNHHVAVPDAFFKVVACMKGTPKGIAFICPNADGGRRADYVVTIESVEKATGFTFFPEMDRQKARRLKTQASLDDWKKRN